MKLPYLLAIDHMGHVRQPESVESPAFKSITRLCDTNRVWVKLSGLYIRSKVGAPTYTDVGTVDSALVKLKPQRLLRGSDWPHPTMAQDQKHDDAQTLDLLGQWAPNETERTMILRDNAIMR